MSAVRLAPPRVLVGLYLVTAAVYCLSGPGRLDSIDAQMRHEVTHNLASSGLPIVADPYVFGPEGLYGFRYGFYDLGPSITGLPAALMGNVFGDDDGELSRFLFSMTSGLVAALLVPLLVGIWCELGFSLRTSALWALVVAFSTLVWPVAASGFDQAQHGVFALVTLWLAWAAARDGSTGKALLAGAAAAMLLNYKISYIVIAPAVVLPLLVGGPGGVRGRMARLAAFCAVGAVGVAFWLSWYQVRFGDALAAFHMPNPMIGKLWGNPLLGLADVIVSPGKGLLFYSPPVLLGCWGAREMWRRDRLLTASVVGTIALHLALISALALHGGDWCWGPRYLVPVIPIGCLLLPFAWRTWGSLGRRGALAVIALGAVVQLAGLAVDHHRFFFERGFGPAFWEEDPAVYWTESSLLSRPAEILDVLSPRSADDFVTFRPGPYPGLAAYSLRGPSDPTTSPTWMTDFGLFYVPRPWPLWFGFVPSEQRPAPMGLSLLGFLGLATIGGALARPVLGGNDKTNSHESRVE